jgi:iron-sulfur cluster insertion protein
MPPAIELRGEQRHIGRMDTNVQTATSPPGGMPGVVFTDAAARKVQELIFEERNPDLKLRVYISGGGCSGFQYGFTFDEERAEDDIAVENDGVTLLIDPLSFQYLAGAEVDYTESLQGAQFVIRNPNAATTCGCGSSFSI